MKIAALILLAPLLALGQTTVTITTPAGVTVKPTIRTTNTSKQVLVTINKADTLVVNGAQINPPPPPPPPMPAMPFVDTAKLMPTAAGFTADRVRTTWFDPLGFYDPATGLPNPSCTGWGNGCLGNAPNPSCTADGPHCQRAPADTPSKSDIGSFRETCAPALMAQIDPIVAPGKAKSAHMHTFFGPPGLKADTTDPATLTASTCAGGPINLTAYWVPTNVTPDGTPVMPLGLVAYYKRAYNGLQGPLQPYAAGHRMVAGDASRSSPGNPVRYLCVATNVWTQSFAPCPAGSEVWMEVAFKQCGNGQLDSPDHSSHMADPVNGVCPATHPIPHAEVRFEVHYLSDGAVEKWRLASDMYDPKLPGGYSGHGDWFNGWKPAWQQVWLDNCINADRDCHAALLGDGRVLY